MENTRYFIILQHNKGLAVKANIMLSLSKDRHDTSWDSSTAKIANMTEMRYFHVSNYLFSVDSIICI